MSGITKRLARGYAIALVAAFGLTGCMGGGDKQPTTTRASEAAGADTPRMAHLAERSFERGQYAAAAQFYRDAAAEAPEALAPRLGLGKSLMALNQPRGAVTAYRAALKIAPDSTEARIALGKALTAADQPDAAVEALAPLTARGTDDYRAYLARGVALDLQGRHTAAQDSYRKGLDQNPGNLSLRNNLGLSLVFAGDTEDGITILRATARDRNATAQTRQNLALAYGLAGRMDRAAAIARRDLDGQAVQRNLAYYEALHAAWTGAPAEAADRTSNSQAATSPEKQAHTAEGVLELASPVKRIAPATGMTEKRGDSGDSVQSTAQVLPPKPTTKPPRPGSLKALLKEADGAPIRLAAALALSRKDVGETKVRLAEDTEADQDAQLNELIGAARAVLSTRAGDGSEATDGHWLRLATLPSRNRAAAEKDRLRESFPQLAKALPLDLATEDDRGSQPVHRLRAGPFTDPVAASRLCRALRDRGQGCLVVRQ